MMLYECHMMLYECHMIPYECHMMPYECHMMLYECHMMPYECHMMLYLPQIPVMVDLARSDAVCLSLRPLVWALAFGACLGGQ